MGFLDWKLRGEPWVLRRKTVNRAETWCERFIVAETLLRLSPDRPPRQTAFLIST